MGRIIQNVSILDENFCRKFQQISLIRSTLHMFDELGEIWNKDDDLIIEYDETIYKHVILHKSLNFKETRPICYIDQDRFDMQLLHSSFPMALRLAWCEQCI